MDDPTSRETVAEAIAFARRFVAERYPAAEAALLAGSRARGEGRPGSDYDVFLLFHALPEGAWREKTWFEGKAFELFGHDPGTLSYFCRTMVARAGVPSVAEMVADGIALVGEGGAALASAREMARRTLAAGPPPFDQALKHSRLSALTELRETLASCPPGPALTSV
ncbi:MAG TPA: nucleotidyltransferase domain-containing protein, partial [Allosphingosinicella sp.]|nr:nucleotidyltransferase domain-containing protein [Allosphingosinicella sp.]